jgi:hypothetical protein
MVGLERFEPADIGGIAQEIPQTPPFLLNHVERL